ncbi:MAG: hypothetical protein U1B30_17350 [Pseudomonadota bacterium]|nr:hypothetical protein [Pseudomonadota bacterium]
MLTLSTRDQLIIGITLTTLMIATRGHHVASLEHLPSASWAVFLLAGIYLRPRWTFAALLALAGSLDYAAITWGGVSNFCASPAYAMLLPAYGALWLAGRWYAKQYSVNWNTLLPLSLAVLVGTAVCQLLSSGGFYFFSGRFVDTTFAEFGTRLVKYSPGALQSLLFYVAMAAVIHVLLILAHTTFTKQKITEG